MAQAMTRARDSTATSYDGFISYSHAADDLLAPRLQSALQRFAKPWWKRRAVRIFRDESSLSANPHLWSSITEALDTSSWFVLLLNPDAAKSEWVNQEIAYWVENRDPKKILPVVTDGVFGWADADVIGDAAPRALRGAFSEEPRWIDLRFAKNDEQLDLKNPRFLAAVADIASAIRGVPKDDLESEEVAQHRRSVRTAWVAGVVMLALFAAAVFSAIRASDSARAAEAARSAEEGARSVAEELAQSETEARLQIEASAKAILQQSLTVGAKDVFDQDPELAVLLLIKAYELGGLEVSNDLVNALWEVALGWTLVDTVEAADDQLTHVQLSPGGEHLVAVSGWDENYMSVLEADGLEPIWTQRIEGSGSALFSPDGSFVGYFTWGLPVEFRVFQTETGVEVARTPLSDCVQTAVWSELGLLTASRACDAPFSEASDSSLALISDKTWEVTETYDLEPTIGWLQASIGEDGDLWLTTDSGDLLGLSTNPFELRVRSEIESGSLLVIGGGHVAWHDNESGSIQVAGLEDGEVIDRFANDEIGGYPIALTPDGHLIGHGQSSLRVWDIASGHEVLQVPSDGHSAIWDVDRSQLVTAGLDGVLRVWSSSQEGPLAVLENLGVDAWINGNSMARGETFGAIEVFDRGGAPNVSSRFFDLETGRLLQNAVGGARPRSLADGSFLVRSDDGTYLRVDPVTGSSSELGLCDEFFSERKCPETAKAFHQVLTSIDGSEIAAIDPEGFWYITELSSGSELDREHYALSGWEGEALAFSDEWVMLSPFDRVGFYERSLGVPRTLLEIDGPVGPFEFSHGQHLMAVAQWPSGRLHLIDLNSWTSNSLIHDFGRVRALGFSPNDGRIAVGSTSELVIVDVTTGSIELRIPRQGVSDVHWLGSETLLVGTWDGLWARVELDPRALLEYVGSLTSRSMTPDECQTYNLLACP